jgi:hypothetical protein
MKTPFLGSAYTSRSLDLACQRAINIFPEIVDTREAKDIGAFFATPGLDLLATVGSGPIRGFQVTPSFLYVASGGLLYKVDTSWNATPLGALGTSSGPVQFIFNGTQVMAVDGTDSYVCSGSTFTPGILAAIGVTANAISYQDGFGVVNNKGTTQWFQSNLFDFSTWSAINFSSADSAPDAVVTLFDNKREVFLFGSNKTEVWINAGLPGFAFQRLQGVYIPEGCAAAASPALVKDQIAWLGSGGVVYLQSGYEAKRISTHAIEFSIQGYSTYADAIGYSYQQEGHFFYVLTFPTGNETWVYDLTTSAKTGVSMWHQRAYFSNGSFSRHLSNCAAFFNNQAIVGDYASGNIYALDLNTYQDNGQPIKRLRSWRAMQGAADSTYRFNELTLDFQTGIKIPDGTNPQAMLRWSDDGGHTFGPQLFASLGQPGETTKRVRWTRLGQTKKSIGLDRIWEVSTTDNIPVAWIGASMDAEQT